MARVTVEDCILEVPNRFELVMLAAQRARRIGTGSALTVARDNDKNPVIALREIAEKTITTDDMREDLVLANQRVHASDEEDANLASLMNVDEDAIENLARLGEGEEAEGEDGDDEEGYDDLESLAGLSEDDEK